MSEEKVIEFIQCTIMNEWRSVMKYEDQLRNIMFYAEDDPIIHDCIANAKERIEIFTIILNKFEQ
jgi:hypothetical protein